MISIYISKMGNWLEIVSAENYDLLNLLVNFWFIRDVIISLDELVEMSFRNKSDIKVWG